MSLRPGAYRSAHTSFSGSGDVKDAKNISDPSMHNLPIFNVRTMEQQYLMRRVDVLEVVTATIGAIGIMASRSPRRRGEPANETDRHSHGDWRPRW